MPKEKIIKQQRPMTRLQLTRWQRDKKRQRIIQLSVITALIVIVLIIGSGYYLNEIKPWHKVVVSIDTVRIDMSYFVKMLRLNNAGADPQYSSYIADQVVNLIQENEIFREEAKKEGLSITAEEIEKYIEDGFKSEGQSSVDWKNRYDKALKNIKITDAEYKNMVVEPVLFRSKVRDVTIEPQVPKESEQVHCEGILLENKDKVDEVKNALQAGDDFAKLVETYSKDDNSRGNKGDMGWFTKGIMGDEFDNIAFSLAAGVLSEPISGVTGASGDQVWLIRVVEKSDNRAIEEDQRSTLVGNALYQWFEEKKSEAKLWSYLDLSPVDAGKVRSWALTHLK